jgi:2-keto-4-pentenoate hydratase/2-oxohepta-3-ene-1,7-dioic acid hydratase in catechol pathway
MRIFAVKGVAGAVISAALDAPWSSGCHNVMLLTGRTDPGVIGFYESCGLKAGRGGARGGQHGVCRAESMVRDMLSSASGMRRVVQWVRFEAGGVERFGTLAADQIQIHTGDLFSGPTPTGETVPIGEVRLLAPVRPGKFIGLWNNFHALAAKTGAAIPTVPLYFLKAPGSVAAPGETIRKPASYDGKVLYEGELGIVIGRRCAGMDEAQAAEAIFGYTCINDVTALDILTADPAFPQWARAKSCDTFGPCGPVIATGLDWADLRIRTELNGRERQNYPASDMILPPARIVSLISQEMTLEPGDLIACGTSLGALPMRPGMVVAVSIEGIGTLTNPYGAAEA